MKAFKCDRCGKLFEHYEFQGTADFFNITRHPHTGGDCLDLCPECNAELQEWVANDKVQVNCTDTEVVKSPCDLCRHNPPSSGDGKPCAMCPAG